MGLLRRIHPLDVALFAVALAAVVFALVTIPGYRWSGDFRSGFLRQVPATITIEVTEPALVRLAAEIRPGPCEAETLKGRMRLQVRSSEPSPDGALVRLEIALTAEVDGVGRAFWADQRLRRGEDFSFADRRMRMRGTIVLVDSPASGAP